MSWGSATDRGRVRALNEDALLACPPIFVVADGMGGHSAGDLASRLTVEEFSRLAGRRSATADEVHACFHRAATRLRDTLDAGRTVGTTVAGVVTSVHEGEAYWLVFNIGDSRVYRLAGGELEQISVDHSVVQELLDGGEISAQEARAHPGRHVITRAVGTGPAPEPDYWLIPADVADRVLICSDGLTAELDDDVLLHLMQSAAGAQEVADALLAAALSAGGRDNTSVVVVDLVAVRPEPGAPAPERVPQPLHPATAPAAATRDETVDGDTVPRPPRPALPEVHP